MLLSSALSEIHSMPANVSLLQKAREVFQAGGISRTGNLCNRIHPLFAPQNFHPAMEYDVLIPVLRLLTRLLDTPQVRHYLFTTWFGRNEQVGVVGARGQELEAYQSDRSVGMLTDGDVAAVQAKLVELATMVRFMLKQLPPHANACCVKVPLTFTEGFSNAANVPTHRLEPFQGTKSVVILAQAWYDTLKAGKSRARIPLQVIHERFSIAMTLLHELGHAANNAVMGRRQEDFFQEASVAEAGFESQARLLGAAASHQPGRPTVLFRWPSRQTAANYAKYKVPVRDLKGVPQLEQRWPLSNAYVLSIQHEWFWKWADQVGPTAFVPECLIQDVRKSMVEGKPAPVPSSIARLFEGSTTQMEIELDTHQAYSGRLRLRRTMTAGEGPKKKGIDVNVDGRADRMV